MLSANTPNHAGDGQNVLYGDGHVDWQPSPFCGSQRPVVAVSKDNIYTRGVNAGAWGKSGGTAGAPQDEHDSVMLPGSDAGPQPSGTTRAERERRRLLLFLGVGALLVIAVAVAVALARRRGAAPAV
jgi:prepilin-type processing-associated H-X9-DG protein